MASINEKKELLELYYDARKKILQGAVVKFSKGDTAYTFLNLNDINKAINLLEIEIQLLIPKECNK